MFANSWSSTSKRTLSKILVYFFFQHSFNVEGILSEWTMIESVRVDFVSAKVVLEGSFSDLA